MYIHQIIGKALVVALERQAKTKGSKEGKAVAKAIENLSKLYHKALSIA